MDTLERDLAAVIRHADDLDGDVQPEIERLCASGARQLVPRLRQALDGYLADGNFYGRDLVAAVLAGIQGTDALETLLRASAVDLGDDQDSLGAEIMELVYANPAGCRPVMLRLIADSDPALRRTGLWALGHAVQKSDFGLLAEAAGEPDPAIRTVALGALGSIRDEQAVFDRHVLALSDPVPSVRIAAIAGLGYYGWPKAVSALAELVADPVPRVRWHLTYSLGRLADRAALPVLRRLAADDDCDVRSNAVKALRSIGGPAAETARAQGKAG